MKIRWHASVAVLSGSCYLFHMHHCFGQDDISCYQTRINGGHYFSTQLMVRSNNSLSIHRFCIVGQIDSLWVQDYAPKQEIVGGKKQLHWLHNTSTSLLVRPHFTVALQQHNEHKLHYIQCKRLNSNLIEDRTHYNTQEANETSQHRQN